MIVERRSPARSAAVNVIFNRNGVRRLLGQQRGDRALLLFEAVGRRVDAKQSHLHFTTRLEHLAEREKTIANWLVLFAQWIRADAPWTSAWRSRLSRF